MLLYLKCVRNGCDRNLYIGGDKLAQKNMLLPKCGMIAIRFSYTDYTFSFKSKVFFSVESRPEI